MFEKALFPVELSQTMEEILVRVKFAGQLGTRHLHLLHVLSPGLGNRKQALRKLDDFGVMLRSFGYGISLDVQEGFPPTLICETARENDIDFIFLPWREKTKMYRAFLGSTAKDVVRLTDKPTFVFKYHPQSVEGDAIKRVLYPTDFGQAAERAEPFVRALGNPDSKLILVHVGERAADPFSEERRTTEAVQRLMALKESFASCFQSVEIHQTTGVPGKKIIKRAKENDAHLIVMGRFNDSPLRKIMGTTAVEVADKVRCSLLLIP